MKIKLLAVTLASLYAVTAFADNKLDLGPSLNPEKSTAAVATSAVPGAVQVPGKIAAPTPVSTATIAPVQAPASAASAAPSKLMQPPAFASGKPSAAPEPTAAAVPAKPVAAPPAPPAKPVPAKTAPVAVAQAPLVVAAPVQLQPTTVAPAPVAEPTAATPAAPQPAAAGEAPKPTMNPFTGRPREVETATREIELLKLKTQALEEQLRQTNIREDMHNIPLRKQVEAAQATTAILKEYSMQKGTSAEIVRPAAKSADTGATAGGELAKPKAKAVVKPKRKSAEKSAETEPAPAAKAAVPVAPPLPQVALSSVISVKGSRSAVLSTQDGSMVVLNGEDTPWGRVLIVDEANVTLGGRPYKVHQNTVSRLVVSDPKPVDPAKANIAVQVPIASVAAPSAPTASTATGGLPPLLPPTDANRGLPPLQLPPGVKILPPAPPSNLPK